MLHNCYVLSDYLKFYMAITYKCETIITRVISHYYVIVIILLCAVIFNGYHVCPTKDEVMKLKISVCQCKMEVSYDGDQFLRVRSVGYA